MSSVSVLVAILTATLFTAAAAPREASPKLASLDRAVKTAATPEERRTALFYRALEEQRFSGDASVADRDALLRSAAADYEAAIAIRSSSAILNNLARVYDDLRDARALAAFEAVYADRTAHDRPAYLKNYANYLRRIGRVADAEKLEREAADLARNQDRDAQQQILMLHLDASSETFIPFLKQLIDLGTISRAEDVMLAAIEDKKLTGEQTKTVYGLLARALSRDHYEPPAFSDAPIARRLTRIAASGGDAAEAAHELVLVFTDHRCDKSSYPWWFNATSPADSSLRGDFTHLATSIGAWYIRHDDLETARDYYVLAEQMAPQDQTLDGVALDLGDLYFAMRDRTDLEALAERYERWFTGGAGTSTTVQRSYAYHRRIGLALADLGAWRSDTKAGSATYHLEEMARLALNAPSDAAGGRRLPFEPVLVEKLGAIYTSSGRTREAEDLRLRAVAYYYRNRDFNSMRALEPRLTGSERIALAAMMREKPSTHAIDGAISGVSSKHDVPGAFVMSSRLDAVKGEESVAPNQKIRWVTEMASAESSEYAVVSGHHRRMRKD